MLRSYELLRAQGYRLIYADRSLFVLNKPPGLISQDSHDGQSMLRPYMSEVLDYHNVKEKNFFPVHRLDKDTTGCLVLARNQRMARNFSNQLQDGTVQKTYLALIQPQDRLPLAETGRIEAPLDITDGRASLSTTGRGKEAITEWEVISRSATSGIHLVRLNLITGLKHQLRVHMDEVLKAPILGDTLHCNSLAIARYEAPSLCLHASQIMFSRFAPKHVKFSVQAPLPLHFQSIYDGLIPGPSKEGTLMINSQIVDVGMTINNAHTNVLERFGSFVVP